MYQFTILFNTYSDFRYFIELLGTLKKKTLVRTVLLLLKTRVRSSLKNKFQSCLSYIQYVQKIESTFLRYVDSLLPEIRFLINYVEKKPDNIIKHFRAEESMHDF